jgi:hypothetical protein
VIRKSLRWLPWFIHDVEKRTSEKVERDAERGAMGKTNDTMEDNTDNSQAEMRQLDIQRSVSAFSLNQRSSEQSLNTLVCGL